MKRPFILLFLILLGCSALADNAAIQNAMLRLDSADNDSTKLALINRISRLYRYVDPEKAMEYAERGLAESENSPWPELHGDALFNIASVRIIVGAPKEAFEPCFDALEIFKAQNDSNRTGNTYSLLGSIFVLTGNYTMSVDYLLKAEEVFEALGNTRGLSGVYNNLSYSYQSGGQVESALEYNQKAIDLMKGAGDQQSEAMLILNKAILTNSANRPDSALRYVEQAEKMCVQYGWENLLINISNIKAEAYYRKGDLEQSEANYKAFLQQDNEEAISGDRGEVYVGLATIYNDQSKFALALQFAERAMKVAENDDNRPLSLEGGKELIRALTGLKRYDQALEQSQKQLTNSEAELKSEFDSERVTMAVKQDIALREAKGELMVDLEQLSEELEQTHNQLLWTQIAAGVFLAFTVFFFVLNRKRA